MGESITILYCPCGSKQEASTLATSLVKAKLAGCANVFPIDSLFVWEEDIKAGDEWVLLVKTTQKNAKQAADYLEKHHSYDTPCILSISAGANASFAHWLGQCTK